MSEKAKKTSVLISVPTLTLRRFLFFFYGASQLVIMAVLENVFENDCER